MIQIVIAEEPADSADVRWCFEQYYARAWAAFGYVARYVPAAAIADLAPPHGVVLDRSGKGGDAVGCGGDQARGARVRRDQAHVGSRTGSEGAAWADGSSMHWKRPRRSAGKTYTAPGDESGHLTAAIAMYRKHGYHEVAAFNDEPFGDHWFEKPLVPR